MRNVVMAWGSDDFEDVLLTTLNETQWANVDALADSYAEDVEFEQVVFCDEDDDEIIAEVILSFTDCQTTGCSNVVLSDVKTLTATIRIRKQDPYDFEIEYSDKDEEPSDYY